jgi:hypothetical protein
LLDLAEHLFVTDRKFDTPRTQSHLYKKLTVARKQPQHFLNQLVINKNCREMTLDRALSHCALSRCIQTLKKIGSVKVGPLSRISQPVVEIMLVLGHSWCVFL